MTNKKLPITRLTLYKHGVGFVEREGKLTERQIELVFRREEVNDALKSLLVIDRSGGMVEGIHYETPINEQTQSKIQLSPDKSVLDLLRGLRGMRLQVRTGDGTTAARYSGQLIGIDVDDEHPLSSSLIALLDSETNLVRTIKLSDLNSLDLLEDRAGQDLRFFLDSSRNDEAHRTVTLQLAESPQEHDIFVSYLVPSPTWRVSYRLVADTATESKEQAEKKEEIPQPQKGNLLIQGWGLFDNRLEEDLEGVKVRLVAGQPISFIYDLASSRIPNRPFIQDTARVAAAPVEFDTFMEYEKEAYSAPGGAGDFQTMNFAAPVLAMPAPQAPEPRMAKKAISREAVASQTTNAETAVKGELFQYDVTAPVTVKRGESALVPILGKELPYKHELLYNGAKQPKNPVAALKFKNETGLVLERGPVTIIEDGEYMGEAIVPFTSDGSEVYLAYAVELGVKVTEQVTSHTETVGLRIDRQYMYLNQSTVATTLYTIENNLDEGKVVTIEHRIRYNHDLYDTGKPDESNPEYYRWNVPCKPRHTTVFEVKERRLDWRSEAVLGQNYYNLSEYLKNKWLDNHTYNTLIELLREQEALSHYQREISEIESEREGLYRRQEQLRQNMAALATTGAEAEFRNKVFNQLRESEERITEIDNRVRQLKEAIKTGQKKIEQVLAGLKTE